MNTAYSLQSCRIDQAPGCRGELRVVGTFASIAEHISTLSGMCSEESSNKLVVTLQNTQQHFIKNLSQASDSVKS